MKNIYINDDDEVLTLEQATARGYRPDDAESMDYLTSPHGWADRIALAEVRSSAIDGKRRPRQFSTLEKAAAYIAAEGWAHYGVSDDGVTVLDGIRFRTVSKSWVHSSALSARIKADARALIEAANA